MKNVTILVTLSVLLGLGTSVFAAESQLTAEQQAALNIGSACTAKVIDQQKFDQSIASGMSVEDATTNAVVTTSFSQKKFDMAMASGISSNDAFKYAAVIKYADNTQLCRLFRQALTK